MLPPLTVTRRLKDTFLFLSDLVLVNVAFWLALYTRFYQLEFLMDHDAYILTSLVISVVFIVTGAVIGTYQQIMRLSFENLLKMHFIAILVTAFAMVAYTYFNKIMLPRTVPILFFAFSLIFLIFSRFIAAYFIALFQRDDRQSVIVYGAGLAGRQLISMLQKGHTYNVKAIIDDDKKLHKRSMLGVRVYGRSAMTSLIERKKVSKIIFAIPSISKGKRKEVFSFLSQFDIDVLSIPNFDDLVNGVVTIDSLKEVSVDDLLGRDKVMPNKALLERNIKGQAVMVTGAGGSIGSELCRQIVKFKPSTIVLFEASEFSLYKIDRELRQLNLEPSINIVPLLGNVQNQQRLVQTMRSFAINTVYHAAAYKHVPLVEYNVVEAVQNNVFGTYYTACAAIEAGVDAFVLISTDKAVRPTNVMGTTKRLAELGLQALAKGYQVEHSTMLSMVRFGNVLGSSGSVIPLFKAQIAKGGPVTVTHKDIIRYFMTIPEAAQLVIQAGAMAKGGDVFVLDMGEPVRIADLAKNLIHLSGLEVKGDHNPEGDIEILYTGLRPGEKLFEELLIGDSVTQTSHSRIMTAQELSMSESEYSELLDLLMQASNDYDLQRLRELMLSAPTGFIPTDGIGDLVWQQEQSIQSQINCKTE